MAKDTAVEELPNCLKNSVYELNAEGMEQKLKWLTQRFCLVEKEAVRKEYKQAAEDYDPYDAIDSDYNQGKMHVLESLFPEIAKEVEG